MKRTAGDNEEGAPTFSTSGRPHDEVLAVRKTFGCQTLLLWHNALLTPGSAPPPEPRCPTRGAHRRRRGPGAAGVYITTLCHIGLCFDIRRVKARPSSRLRSYSRHTVCGAGLWFGAGRYRSPRPDQPGPFRRHRPAGHGRPHPAALQGRGHLDYPRSGALAAHSPGHARGGRPCQEGRGRARGVAQISTIVLFTNASAACVRCCWCSSATFVWYFVHDVVG
jgi:hypothetical protein